MDFKLWLLVILVAASEAQKAEENKEEGDQQTRIFGQRPNRPRPNRPRPNRPFGNRPFVGGQHGNFGPQIQPVPHGVHGGFGPQIQPVPGTHGGFGPQIQPVPGISGGFHHQGFIQQPGLIQPGFPQPGFPQPGFPQPGFPQPGFPQQGFQQPGLSQQGGGVGTSAVIQFNCAATASTGQFGIDKTCKKFCRAPNTYWRGEYVCCDDRPAVCPPVRATCPKYGQGVAFPVCCFVDSQCPRPADKCCFDTCLRHKVCKEASKQGF